MDAIQKKVKPKRRRMPLSEFALKHRRAMIAALKEQRAAAAKGGN